MLERVLVPGRPAAWSFCVALLSAAAHADDLPSPEASKPERLAQAFIHYGGAVTGEFIAAPGPMCSVHVVVNGMVSPPGCILGNGGGLAVRFGKRFRSPFYLGGAYEFVKTDSAQLYRLGILQQLRGEGRYYFPTGYTIEPYLVGALGVAVYGNLWGIDTGGPALGFGAGVEIQLANDLVVGLAVTYRPIFLAQFHDSSETSTSPPSCNVDPSCHPAGFAHLIGVELVVEPRVPL